MSSKRDFLIEIIADFHRRPLPTLTHRRIPFEIVPSKVVSLSGVRRSGKTFCLYQLMQGLLEKGVSKENILFVNFEDERLIPMATGELSLILEAFYELYPAKKEEKIYLFLDEIQNVAGWAPFVRRIQDSENVQVFITGSSAKLMSREIATTLRGRTLNYEVFPFSFSEYLDHQGVNSRGQSSSDKAKIRHALASYLLRGGFPEILGASETVWRMTLQDYLNLIVYRDIVERHAIKNQQMIKYLIKFLLRNIAAPITINKLYRDLKSQGYQIAKDTLHLYLDYLEEAYTFFAVPVFSESVRVRNVNYRKIYTVDIGFVNSSSYGLSEKRGSILENTVFLHLRRDRENEICYYKTRRGKEIDFLVMKGGKLTGLIQVAENLEEHSTFERESASLWEAMEELKSPRGWILTRDTEKKIRREGRVIEVVPAWKWLNIIREAAPAQTRSSLALFRNVYRR
ncbi:MAG: ATP-binding protein [Deltaproteobacteria bacterium]|nr:ATP-binding protein [Deltaproteobacteria bacterium]